MNEIILCDFLTPAYWLFFGENVPALVFYTHIPNVILSILLAVFVIMQKPRLLQHKIFFWTLIAFVTWVVFAQMFWASNRADVIMFSWLIDILVEPLVHIGILYLLYVLLKKRDVSLTWKVVFGLLYLPIPLFLATPLTLQEFDLTSCLAIEGPIALYYTYLIEIIATIGVLFLSIRHFLTTEDSQERKKILYLSIGSFLFLLTFSWGNIVGSFTENWELGQYGLFGMPIFTGFLVYTIVQFKLFSKNILGAQALVAVSCFLLFALLFVEDISNFRVILVLNLGLFSVLGYQLIRSVRLEIRQRKEIEGLVDRLEKVNKRLKILDQLKSEFVSIASHQLRSPLTAIRGYTSMLQEGSFGKLPQKAQEAVSRISESSRLMSLSVEDYLNVSRIQSGNMKYELSEFNLRDLISKIVDDMRREAMRKGLLLTFKDKVERSSGLTKADVGKTNQIVYNLVDNAMKYTPKGKIEVSVDDTKKSKMLTVTIVDTGIGMKPEKIGDLFQKFERADNANSVNVTGTGLGLYIARKMAQDMGGDIIAASEGEGEGSSFTFTLPLIR